MVKMYEFTLTDAQWRRIADLLPDKVGDPGRTGNDNRLFERRSLSAAIWRAVV